MSENVKNKYKSIILLIQWMQTLFLIMGGVEHFWTLETEVTGE